MRTVVFRHDDLPDLLEALEAARGQDLALPADVQVREGEWVLALFEFSSTSRATAAAGKGVLHDHGSALLFERRDWERLRQFASAARSDSSMRMQVSGERPSASGGAPSTLRRTQGWESEPEPVEEPPTTTPDPEIPAHMAGPPQAVAAGPRLLLVDDDPDLRDVVATMLETVGLEVEAVGSAEEALDRIRSASFDLVVLDWNLPGMSGLDFCRVVRGDRQLAGVPLLFLTAHAATQDMVEAFAAGADDYVVKPFRAAELGARIFGLLRRTRGAIAHA